MNLARVLLAGALVMAAWNVARGQGDDAYFPSDPARALQAVREAYRAGPVAERMTVRAELTGGRARSSFVNVFVDASGDEPRARLEMGNLVLSAAGERLLVSNRRQGGVVFRGELDGKPTLEGMEVFLPRLSAPQLEFAFGEKEILQPSAYAAGLRWTSVELPPVNQRSVLVPVIHGRSSTGDVELHVDPATGRMRKLVVEAEMDNRVLMITMTVDGTIRADESAGWMIDEEGAVAVESLQELARSAAVVGVGDLAPAISLIDLERGGIWRLGRAAGDGPVILVMADIVSDPRSVGETIIAVQRTWKAIERVEGAAGFVQGISLTGRDAGERLPEEIGWLPVATRYSTMDRFSTEASVLIVVVGPDSVILDVIEPVGLDESVIKERVETALAPRGETPSSGR